MIFWIRQLTSFSRKEKIMILLFLVIQSLMAYRHFFMITDKVTWNELIFSLILLIPWILSLTFYLNFKFLPLHSTFLRIRLSLKQRLQKTIEIIGFNLIFSSMIPFIVELFALLSKDPTSGSFVLILEIILRYGLFLSIASLLQVILMSVLKNKGFVTILLYIVFFMGSYLQNKIILSFLYPSLYPVNLTISGLLISIGYLLILGMIYTAIEEKSEHL